MAQPAGTKGAQAARVARPAGRRLRRAAPRAVRYCAGLAAIGFLPGAAHAQAGGGTSEAGGLLAGIPHTLAGLDNGALIAVALVLGLIAFATTTAIVHVRYRALSARRETGLLGEIARLEAQIEEGRALLLAEPQVIVVWREPTSDPDIIGNTAAFTGASAPTRILAFGTWLTPASAQEAEEALHRLRRRGAAMTLALQLQDGRHVEAEGRPVGSAVVLRLREVTGVRDELARLADGHRRLEADTAALRALLEALPAPVWVRGADGRLAFANAAFANAVEAKTVEDAAQRGLSLFDAATAQAASRAQEAGGVFSRRIPLVVAGKRRALDVLEVRTTGGGTAGIALDAAEAEAARAELAAVIGAHRSTLDRLTTAVAIFDRDRRLAFHNAAYASLFELDPAFLDERPTDGAVLDRLRAARRLPEQADFRTWRDQLHEAYRAVEPREHWWHLPGGRTLRVVTAPNPEGGVTYLCDEVTERLALESRYNALIRIQSETLDALAEAVAVFRSDGRLGLTNSAFLELWRLAPAAVAERPHVDAVVALCRPLASDAAMWSGLRSAVTAMEERRPGAFRIERNDGVILDGSTQPLPDGGTLVTFRNVTDSVHVERALVERNEALIAADQVKSTFVSHVSYELRSPLTTIIGFAQLLDDAGIGPLNVKQRAYVSHITESSAALLAIINDILDLATIDAGTMTLDLAEVDVRAAMEGAAEGVRDRLAEGDVKLDIVVPDGVGGFRADAKRVRQILFNLLSNAVGFAPAGSTVTLSAQRGAASLVLSVRDEGPGIPPEVGTRVFDRFESHTSGSRHRGVGLGLSLVRSLMALHGGTVAIAPAPGGGTVVTCTFPLDSGSGRAAAE